MTEEVAAHVIRFFKAPTSRTYILTYQAGRKSATRTWRASRSAFAGC
jgi:hypothetical protein